MQKNKRNILTLGIISAVTCFGIASGLIFTSTFKPVAANGEHKLQFSDSLNRLNNGPTEVKTNEDNKYLMTHSGMRYEDYACWAYFLKSGATFSITKNTNYIHDNGFYGMKTLEINFALADSQFRIYFSNDGTFSESYSRLYTSKQGINIIDFEGHPNYFKFESLANNRIYSMTIKYSCDPEEDNKWNSSHGVTPGIWKTYCYYGLYPQKHVSDENVIAALDAKATELGVKDEEYFWYNDEYYVRDTCDLYAEGYTFSTGVVAQNGATYYFLCQQMVWNIVYDYYEYTLDCTFVVNAHRFSESSNAYASSELRTWLNNDFYKKAFFPKITTSRIIPTSFKEIGSDKDNFWVGSYSEYSNGGWYQKDADRQKKVSDFAICNKVFMSYAGYNSNGVYWTHTVYPEETNHIWVVGTSGFLSNSVTSKSHFGVSPSMTVSK